MTEDVALTGDESRELAELEATIDKGLTTFVDVGNALLRIRDGQLYRVQYVAFEDYCQDRWGMGRAHAYRLMSAAEAVSPIGDTGLPLPTNEGQARELARVPEAHRAEVWERVLSETGGKPTAAAIRHAAEPEISPEQRVETADKLRARALELERLAEGVEAPLRRTEVVDDDTADGIEDLERSLDEAMSDTAVRFRRNWSSAVARAVQILSFDADRVAEVYATDYETSIERGFFVGIEQFIDKVREARRRQTSGLRVVKGGRAS